MAKRHSTFQKHGHVSNFCFIIHTAMSYVAQGGNIQNPSVKPLAMAVASY
jgi:hypothetical protein